jgi:hypothetical protein
MPFVLVAVLGATIAASVVVAIYLLARRYVAYKVQTDSGCDFAFGSPRVTRPD